MSSRSVSQLPVTEKRDQADIVYAVEGVFGRVTPSVYAVGKVRGRTQRWVQSPVKSSDNRRSYFIVNSYRNES